MTKKKNIIIAITVVIVIAILLTCFLLRTPSEIKVIEDNNILSIDVRVSEYFTDDDDVKYTNYFIEDNNSICEFVELIEDANFKYSLAKFDGMTYTGGRLTIYNCELKFEDNTKTEMEFWLIDDVKVRLRSSVTTDGKLLKFGAFDDTYYDSEKEVFLGKLINILESHDIVA